MSRNKISIGITGGIGSGKSYVCQRLEKLHIPVFYTDPEATKEMLENIPLQLSLQKLIGRPFINKGILQKDILSSFLRASADNAKNLDALVHPFVRQRMEHWIDNRKEPLVAVECALLFESGFDHSVTYTVLVTAPLEVRIRRVMKRDGKREEEVRQWISMQMDEEEKHTKADFIITNDGTGELDNQIQYLLSLL